MSAARRLLSLAVVLVAALPLTGCGGFRFQPFTAEEVVAESFRTTAPPRVVVEVFNGGIEVVTGAADTVLAEVTKRGSGGSEEEAEDDLENIEVTMTQTGDEVRITARRTDARVTGNSGASAEVKVPPGSVLDLRTTNGGLTVSGATGAVTGKTSNGKVRVTGSEGRLDLTSSNGGITVQGGAGELKLHTSNGPIQVQTDGARVTAQTSNGKVSFTGTLADGESSLHSSNGSISVTLPANARFRVDASTSNGSIASDFAVKLSGGTSRTHLQGTVGEHPAVSLSLKTSNGGIELRQK
jgi:DUF4097 and DUF4098 domain-containing protein YvlB